MGPFRHTVDDGLDIRKAAFECMYTLLDACLDRIDVFEFLNHLELGLKDHYDIKMLTYLMVARLAQLCPSAVLQSKSTISIQKNLFRFSDFDASLNQPRYTTIGAKRTYVRIVLRASKSHHVTS